MTLKEYELDVVGKNPQPLFRKLMIHHAGTAAHCLRTSYLCYMAAQQMGFSMEDTLNSAEGALLHDVGMLKVPPRVLDNPELSFGEAEKLKLHPAEGYKMYLDTRGCNMRVAAIILQHHEFLDGSGYPMGITGGQMLKISQLVTVANAYDNLRTRKNIQLPYTADDVFRYLVAKNQQYNEKYVGAMHKLDAELGIYKA